MKLKLSKLKSALASVFLKSLSKENVNLYIPLLTKIVPKIDISKINFLKIISHKNKIRFIFLNVQ